jgi:magnesium chelatase family protein
LPETEVKEARDRVRAAIQNGGYEMPAQRIKCCQPSVLTN